MDTRRQDKVSEEAKEKTNYGRRRPHVNKRRKTDVRSLEQVFNTQSWIRRWAISLQRFAKLYAPPATLNPQPLRGLHLIIDGYDCHSDLLSDRDALLRWLDDLPAQIGMSILMPAAVSRIEYPDCKPEDKGLSGVVIICESHIAVHTWPRRKEIQADVYSCRPFDAEKVLAHFVHDFSIGSYDTDLIERRKRKDRFCQD